MNDADVISNIGVFRLFSQEALKLLVFAAERYELVEKASVFGVNEKATGGFLLLRGSCRLTQFRGNPERSELIRQPCVLAKQALVQECLYQYTAQVEEPSVVLKVSRLLFTRILQEFPEIKHSVKLQYQDTLIELTNNIKRWVK